MSFPPRLTELVRLFATRPRTAIAILDSARIIAPLTKAFQRGEDDKVMRIFAEGVLGKERFERLSEARKQQIRDNLSTLRAGVLRSGYPPLCDDDVRAVRAPALLVTGELNPAWLLRLTDRLAELLPTADRVEIAGASHLMHEENAPAVNDAILGFLGRHRGRPASPPAA